jgi:acetylornithine deacetylase/succinyl-diaminopimelate desuccinylase-like protein
MRAVVASSCVSAAAKNANGGKIRGVCYDQRCVMGHTHKKEFLMTATNERIDAYLTDKFDDFINTTIQLCRQPSVSARNEGTRECADLVAQILADRGFAVQKFETPGNPIIVAHLDGEADKTLLFYNHYDVQPPEPLELWTTPPYEPTIRDGALYARGAQDDKGEFVARLAGVMAAKSANGGKLPCGVTFIVEGQEEIGSPHIAQFVKDHADLLKCQAAIWEEGGIDPTGAPAVIVGVRGILAVELHVKTIRRDAHSGNASVLPNAAWRLVKALATLKDSHDHIRIPGFYDAVKPISDLDKQHFDKLPDMDAFTRDEFGIDGKINYVRGRSGRELDYAVFEPTCNIEGITTGYQGEGTKTVIPAEAMCKIDFRLVPDQDPTDILDKLRKHLNSEGFADVEIRYLGQMWPYKAAPDNAFIELVARTGEAVYGKPAVVVPMIGGSTPIYAFAQPLGEIPVALGPGVYYGRNNNHSPNEHVRLNDFKRAAQHVGRIVAEFAQV